ncbi:hypothetical protein PAT3040_01979 [Paenibacillus agaridevorans]|uniref:Uncharacterized protein n=1 Tax=Paenibacillus agaridevorans TaxID=171404 RepID=A0A2R5EQX4_9BACL|nr:hypothetical protein [Paenibacillus agaridevorans]GBG07428.1 hypothetical protein PAT3040_01979 [Paenibacillus agaridevorans]
MMKKTKQPGDNISLKTRKNENAFVMAWINAQSNLMDSLRYLVEREVAANGVRNLQTCVPVERKGLQGLESGAAHDTRHNAAWRETSTARAMMDEGAVDEAQKRAAPSAGEQADGIRWPMESDSGEAAIMRYLAMSGASDEAIQAAFIAARQLAAASAADESPAAASAVDDEVDELSANAAEEEVDEEDVEAWS